LLAAKKAEDARLKAIEDKRVADEAAKAAEIKRLKDENDAKLAADAAKLLATQTAAIQAQQVEESKAQ